MTEREEFDHKIKNAEPIDFKFIISQYTRYWYVFLISVIVAICLAFVYLKFTTPKYLIYSSLVIRDIDKTNDFQTGNPVFRDLDIFNAATSIENEIEALKAQSILQRVLSELSLQISYYVNTQGVEREIYGQNLPIRVLVNKLKDEAYEKVFTVYLKDQKTFVLEDETKTRTTHTFGQVIKKPYGEFSIIATPALLPAIRGNKGSVIINFNDIANLVKEYSSTLTVARVSEDANVISISMLYPLPEKGKDIINKLVEVYNKEAQEDQNRLALNTIQFIDNRLQDLSSDLGDVERSVEEYKSQNQVTDVRSEATAAIEESRTYNRQLSELNNQIEVLESLDRYLSQPQNRYQLVPSNLNIDDETLGRLVQNFNELQLERERMLRTTNPSNPLVINLNEQITNVQLNILENLRLIKRGLLVSRNNIAGKAGSFQSRISRVPTIERELNNINRQQGVKNDLYVYLLQKREESALSLAATGTNTRLLDPAVASKKPVEPNKPVAILVALVLGLGLPFAGIFLKNFMDNTIKRRREVERITSFPILGEIGHKKKKEAMIISDTSRTPLAEQFRLIRSKLNVNAQNQENKVFLITSSQSNEGKTFFCLNLGLTLSLAGKKVVLLGMDFRNPSLLKNLGLTSPAGTTEFLLSDKVLVKDVIIQSPVSPNLFILESGTVPPNPAELMLHPRVEVLLNDLKKEFDFILIDSAPVGQVADAFALNPFINQTIFLIRYNYTTASHLSLLQDIQKNNTLKQPMVVLNDARKLNSQVATYGYQTA